MVANWFSSFTSRCALISMSPVPVRMTWKRPGLPGGLIAVSIEAFVPNGFEIFVPPSTPIRIEPLVLVPVVGSAWTRRKSTAVRSAPAVMRYAYDSCAVPSAKSGSSVCFQRATRPLMSSGTSTSPAPVPKPSVRLPLNVMDPFARNVRIPGSTPTTIGVPALLLSGCPLSPITAFVGPKRQVERSQSLFKTRSPRELMISVPGRTWSTLARPGCAARSRVWIALACVMKVVAVLNAAVSKPSIEAAAVVFASMTEKPSTMMLLAFSTEPASGLIATKFGPALLRRAQVQRAADACADREIDGRSRADREQAGARLERDRAALAGVIQGVALRQQLRAVLQRQRRERREVDDAAVHARGVDRAADWIAPASVDRSKRCGFRGAVDEHVAFAHADAAQRVEAAVIQRRVQRGEAVAIDARGIEQERAARAAEAGFAMHRTLDRKHAGRRADRKRPRIAATGRRRDIDETAGAERDIALVRNERDRAGIGVLDALEETLRGAAHVGVAVEHEIARGRVQRQQPARQHDASALR